MLMAYSPRDIVEDSEPERVRLRLVDREQREEQRRADMGAVLPFKGLELVVSPIGPSTVVRISSTSSSPVEEVFSVGAYIPVNTINCPPPTSMPTLAKAHTDVIVIDSEEENSESDMRQRLAGFRYASASLGSREGSARPGSTIVKRHASGASASASSSGSLASPAQLPPVPRARTVSATSTSLPKERPKRAVAFPCLATFSDARLAKLGRCISCELTWTTRKTVVEKVKHISACAKKHSLDNATLSHLIEKVLLKEPEAPPPSKKKAQKKVEDDVERSPKTLFTHIRTVDEPKKRRRPAVLASVHDPTIAAALIRDRAKDLFGITSGDEPTQPVQPPRWTPSGARLLAVAQATSAAPVPAPEEAPLTQPFGKSALAAGQTKAVVPRSLFMSYDVPITDTSDGNPLPTTQTFTPSNLASNLSRSLDSENIDPSTSRKQPSSPAQLILGHRDSTTLDSPPPSLDASTSTSVPASTAPVASFNPGPSTPFLPHEASTSTMAAWPLLRADDPIISSSHQDSYVREYQLDSQWADDPAHNVHDTFPTPIPDAGRRTKPRAGPSRLVPAAKDSPTKPSKRKGPARTLEDDLNAVATHPDLETKMLEAIRADEVLYLRILRFEPIDFEVFMQLARDAGFAERGLKLVLKPLLDKHAVQFYGAEGTVGRSRVKKRALAQLTGT